MSIKKKTASFVGATPLWRCFEPFHHSARILFYHGVESEPLHNGIIQGNQIPIDIFRKQIEFYQQHFQFISLDEFRNKVDNKEKFNGKELVLTFDDGYRNNYSVAAPLLFEKQIPFTIYISTRCVDNKKRVPTYYVRSAIYGSSLNKLDIPTLGKSYEISSPELQHFCNSELITIIKSENQEKVKKIVFEIENNIDSELRQSIDDRFQSEKLMSWGEIKELSDNGVIIASHTLDHAILHKNQSDEQIREQLEESKKAIELHTLKACDYFAFPNGNRASVCVRSLKIAGEFYDMSFAVDGKCVQNTIDRNFISRIGIADDLGASVSQTSILSKLW